MRSHPKGLPGVGGTSAGDVLSVDGSGVVSWTTPAASPDALITTRGDLIYGDATAAAARLAVGTAGQVLGTDGTDVSWVAGVDSILTTRGDLIREGASGAERVALGADNTVLASDGTDAAWEGLPSLLAATMTTRGDLLYVDSGGTVTRLPVGTNGQVVTTDGTDVSWGTAGGGATAPEVAAYLTTASAGGAYPREDGTAAAGWGVLFATSEVDAARRAGASVHGHYMEQDTSTASGNVAYWVQNSGAVNFDPASYWIFQARVGIEDSASVAYIAGLSRDTVPSPSATPPDDAAIFQFIAGTDTNWMFVTKNGTSTRADTGVTFATGVWDIWVESTDGGTTIRWAIKLASSTSWTTGTTTADVPNAVLWAQTAVETTTTAVRSIRQYGWSARSTYQQVTAVPA